MSLRFTRGFLALFLAFFALVTPPAKPITNISIMENMIDVKIKTDFTEGSIPNAIIEKIGKNITISSITCPKLRRPFDGLIKYSSTVLETKMALMVPF